MKRLMIFFGILLLTAAPLFARNNLNARSIAHLNSYAINARGWEAIGNNPATLGYYHQPLSINFGLLPLVSVPSLELGNSSLSMSLLNKEFFIGEQLSESNKKALLDAIPADGLEGYLRLNQNILTLGKGHFAFGLGVETYAGVNLPKSIIELGLVGNEFDRSIDFDDTQVEALGFVRFSMNYGRELRHEVIQNTVKRLYWGAGVDILFGGVYERIDKMAGEITTYTDHITIKGDAEAKAGAGGMGFGLDFGVAADINDKVSAGIHFQNLISHINWGTMNIDLEDGESTMKAEYSYSIDLMSSQFFDENVDSLLEDGINKDTTYAIKSFGTSIPGGYNINGTYKFSDNLKFSSAIYGHFTNDFGLTRVPNVSVSVNYSPVKWWPVILGIGTVRQNDFAWSFGTGLNFNKYHLDFGLMQYGGMFNFSKGFFIALDQSFYF